MNFPKNASKQHKVLVYQYVAHFVEKKVFVSIFIPFYWFDQKHLFKQIQIFLWIYPFSNMVRKTNFLSFSVIVFDSVTFVSKKNSFLWISPKIFKTTERQFSSMWLTLWRKRAFVNIYPILMVLLKTLV